MKKIHSDLYVSKAEQPFNNTVTTVSYFIKSNKENYLLYSSSHLLDNLHSNFIKDNGGVKAQILNHRDEASPILKDIRNTFQSKLVCHELEKDAITNFSTIDHLITDETPLFDNFKVIHTPGHAPGSTSYLYSGQKGNYLFTGDTLYLSQGQFRVAISDENRLQMIESLLKLQSLEVDGIFPGLYIGDESFRLFNTNNDFSKQLQPLITSLQNQTFR
ncbi:MAG: MBL fold metallo-hydrolase [Candidatus Cloacimonetes bacterium]|nr:MBL fold metallo-hydrolase [Candidatus Cloacimonadota bacterium]